MIKNYFKIALRSIKRQKLFALINVSSLSIGLTCTILIYLFIWDEVNYDRFNDKGDEIYRVVQRQNGVDGSLNYNGIFHAIGMGPTLKEEVVGVNNFTRFFLPFSREGRFIKTENLTSKEQILYADFSTFDMFSFPLKYGSTENPLPQELVLTERMAQKFFNRLDVVGEKVFVRIEEKFVEFEVAAIAENIPSSSSIQFDILINFSYLTDVGYLKADVDEWGFGAIITYVEIENSTNLLSVQEGGNKILANYYPHYARIAEERGYESAFDYRQIIMQPLHEIHFDTSVLEGVVPSSNRLYSIILLAIAFGILVIGCINFMNLSIARSSGRAKEVGLRKVVGASKKQLFYQFISESMLLSTIGLIFAVVLSDLLLPHFNYLTGKNILRQDLYSVSTISWILPTTIFMGFLSGIYPSLVLSSFKMQDTFSGKLKIGGTNLFTRILVVFQFALSTFLIIGLLGMTNQMKFIYSKDLGFAGEQVLVINNLSQEKSSMYNHFKTSLQNQSSILNITSADQNFGSSRGLGGRGFTYKGESKRIGVIKVSPNYIETLGITLKEGRNFEEQLSSDYSKVVIVNEAAYKDFDLVLNQPFEDFGRSPENFPTVVGVMNDFNYSSLQTDVLPMMIVQTDRTDLGYILLKINTERLDETLETIEDSWNEIAPDLPFEYSFLNQTINAQYLSEKRWSSILTFAMTIAILLSSAGLFGLVAIAIAGRKSEIGIRKILGASISNLVLLFGWKYTKLVVIGFILAVPLAYSALDYWLSTFSYRINISPVIFIGAAVVLGGISLLTVLSRVFSAASENPVNVLNDK